MDIRSMFFFFFSSRRRHTRCALVTEFRRVLFRSMKLKLGPIVDDKPVKVTLELPASLHRDLTAYAEALGREESHALGDPVKPIVPLLERFISSDRAFANRRRNSPRAAPSDSA